MLPDAAPNLGGLKPWPGRPVLMGGDAGLNAALVFGQTHWDSRAQVLQSVVTPDGHVTDAETLGEHAREICSGEYVHHAVVGMLDPAAFARDPSQRDMRSWADTFIAASGIPCIPAPTNSIERRHKAVRRLLNGYVGASPRLQIDGARNETLVEGFQAGYRVRRLKGGEDVQYAAQPDKNHFSHVHDAMQYLALLMGSANELVDEMIELQADRLRSFQGGDGRLPQTVINDWN